MQKRRFTIISLFIINILILIATVVPHHHHGGVPCILLESEEIAQHCNENNGCKPDSNPCGDDCITKFEFRGNVQDDASSHLTAPIYTLLGTICFDFNVKPKVAYTFYIPQKEKLYILYAGSSSGLRGPPSSVC